MDTEEITVVSIEITKVKIETPKKGNQKLEIEFIKNMSNGEKRPASEVLDAPQHADLKQSFLNVRVHLGLMIGHIRIKEIKNILTPPDELVDPFTFHSFSIGGDDEDPGVTLTGHVILWNKKAFNFVVPYYRISESEETRYKFMDDLMAKMDRIDTEIKAYMSGEKRGTDPQGNLFDQPVVNKVQVLPPLENGEEEKQPELFEAPAQEVDNTGQEGAGIIVDPKELLAHIEQNDTKPTE